MKDYNSSTQPDLEKGLEKIFPQPEPAFLSRLEGELVHQARLQSAVKRAPEGFSGWFHGLEEGLSARRRTALALGLALLLGVIVLAVGPQQVMAAVLRLFGYAPGVGFVEPGVTRFLAAPVEARQGDVSVKIDRLVASGDRTLLSLTASGLPSEKFEPVDNSPEPYLLLPDGRMWYLTSMMLGQGDTLQAEIDFPALPTDVLQVTLVLPRLPTLPAGFAPENWSIPLALQKTAETPGENGLILPYTLAGATAASHGVTARVIQAAQSAQETGLEVQLSWDNPAWQYLSGLHMRLADDLGRQYERLIHGLGETTGSVIESAPNSQTMLLRFAPFLAGASKATLTFDQLVFTTSSRAAFTFDPGRDPQPGQTWDLAGQPGMQLDLGSVPVEVLKASLQGTGNAQAAYRLEFLLQVKPQDSLSIQSFPRLTLEPQNLGSYMVESLPGDQLRLGFDLAEMPRQPVTVRFELLGMLLEDPLHMTWDLPVEK
jgi:hypothetical protein